MSDEEGERPIRRILVAIDASPHSLAALQAAADIAAQIDAELVGMFVEDINLLRMADLPFSVEVSHYSATIRHLNRAQVEIELHAQASKARKALAAISDRARIRYTFRITRGVIATELIQAALETEMIALGKTGWSHRKQLGSTARLVVSQNPRQALILGFGSRMRMPVGVVYDGSIAARRALESAVGIKRDEGDRLIVFLVAEDVEKARALQTETGAWLRERGLEYHFRWMLSKDKKQLFEMIKSENLGILVLPGESEVLPIEDLEGLVNQSDIPVLVVR